MTLQWSDLTGWATLFAPEDGPAITATVLAQIQDGQAKGATLFSSQYSITDAPILEAMGVIGAANPACRFLFDSSEFAGTYEKPLVEALIAKLQPDQWAIGTAPDGHDILHNKVCSLLYPDGTGWSFFGSFNLSGSAEKESNNAHFVWSHLLAEALAGQVQTGLTWCRTNQPQPPNTTPRGDTVGEGHEGVHEDPPA